MDTGTVVVYVVGTAITAVGSFQLLYWELERFYENRHTSIEEMMIPLCLVAQLAYITQE